MRPAIFWVFFFIFSSIFLLKGQTCQAWGKLTNSQTFDVAVLGGSSGGISAAIQAARMGMKVALIDRNYQPGGEWGNGFEPLILRAPQSYGGLYKELSDSLMHAFTREWKADPDYSNLTFYTPSVAAAVWEELIRKEKNISLFRSFQFDPLAENIRNPTTGGPKQIRIFNTKKPKKSFWISATIWIDGTREGDLAKAFGCRVRTGVDSDGEFDLTSDENVRAQNDEFAFLQDSILRNTFSATNPIIRFGLTRNPEKKSIRKPEGYQREEFFWLGASLQNGSVTSFLSDGRIPTSLLQSESTLANACSLSEWVLLPQTLIEKARNYPDLSWSQRDSVQKKARLFVQGLLWFAQNDTSLPNSFHKKALHFGLPKSDFQDNEYFPPHILLTDASRVEGKMIFTEEDWTCETGQRPVIHRNSIAVGSIETRKDGNPKNEKIHFTIPFETIVPVGNEQILCPVPFFATHEAAQNPAMEAVRIQLGQTAGVAAALSIRKAILVSKVPVDSVQNELIRIKANMVFVEDVPASDPYFDTIQKTALLGWIQGYSARLDDPVIGKDIELWSARSGFSQKEINELVGKSSRRDALKALLKKYQDQWKAKL